MPAKPLTPWSQILLVALVASGLAACQGGVSEDQLEAWHQAAIEANQREQEKYGNRAEQQQWQLTIQGQIQTEEAQVFDWATLQTLAQTEIIAKDPSFRQSDQAFTFRGIPVATLLDQVGVEPGVQEITFAAFDGFRTALPLSVLRDYPISLALERNGQPIPRSEGGPLYLIFPNVTVPGLAQRYTGVNWVFYVTDIIVGNENPRLQVQRKAAEGDPSSRPNRASADPSDDTLTYSFTDTQLQGLPPVTISAEVGYRLFWPSEPVVLQGVRIQDILEATGVKVSPETTVTVLGKVPIHHDPKQPIQISGQQLATCDILLATRWGDRLEPIPARMGGPITLAFSPSCPAAMTENQPWTIFVESLEVTQP
ncbi:MAG: molybdopterin-dependent oxidoreductase [Prochlorothrix sp.]